MGRLARATLVSSILAAIACGGGSSDDPATAGDPGWFALRPLQGGVVLVIDDNATTRDALRELLRRKGPRELFHRQVYATFTDEILGTRMIPEIGVDNVRRIYRMP